MLSRLDGRKQFYRRGVVYRWHGLHLAKRAVALTLSALCLALVAASAVAGIAVAGHIRADWDCSGAPYDDCYAPQGVHTWDSVTAVNATNAYRKCAEIVKTDYSDFQRNCASATYVRIDWTSGGVSSVNDYFSTYAIVTNDTSTRHGLRGVGTY